MVRCTGRVVLALCAALLACDRSVARDTADSAGARAAPHEFLVTTTDGDTLALEQVQEGPTWWESALRLPRRGEFQRIVLQVDSVAKPRLWEVTTQRLTEAGLPDVRRAATRWRVLATADSLFVAEGAPIGVPVRVQAVSATSDVQPWHRESPGLLEQLVRVWRQRPRAPQRVLTWPAHEVTDAPRVRALGADSVLVAHPAGEWRLRVDSAGRLLGGVSPSRGLRLQRTESSALANPGSEARSGAVDVRLTASDGVTLAGSFRRPSGAARGPLAILVSGSGPQDRDLAAPGLVDYRLFATLADSLAGRGLAVLRLDDRGVGASGGAAFSSSQAQEVRDLQTAIDWARTPPDWKTDGIVLIAHSDGALAALDVAAAQPLGTMRALVLLGAPARSGRELARAQRAQFVRADSVEYPVGQRATLLRRLERETERLAAVDPWLRDWLDADPRTRRWRVPAPVLIVHGERDQQVPVSHATELAELLRQSGAPSVRVLTLPDVNHLLVADANGDPRGYRELPSRVVDPVVFLAVLDWLQDVLTPSNPPATRPDSAP